MVGYVLFFTFLFFSVRVAIQTSDITDILKRNRRTPFHIDTQDIMNYSMSVVVNVYEIIVFKETPTGLQNTF